MGNGNGCKIFIEPSEEEDPTCGREFVLGVRFSCGREVAVNRNTKYALEHFDDNPQVIKWACEILSFKSCKQSCGVIQFARAQV